MTTATGTLFIISAPSGAGKTTLVNNIVSQLEYVRPSVSHTTRPPRSGEQHGVDYYFISTAEFSKMAAAGKFLEHAQVFDNHYGTSVDWVEATVQAGQDVILEIDWQGARQINAKYPTAVSIFILPPSVTALKQRLTGRDQDDTQVIANRLAAARDEISHYSEYDYIIVNEQLEQATFDLVSIISSRRLLQERQQVVLATMLRDLLT